MSWEESLKKTMFAGERLVWKCKVKKEPETHVEKVAGWSDEEIYFTTQRILWRIYDAIPQSIPYSSTGRIETGPTGSGGIAGVTATAKGGGVIDIIGNVKSIGFQFDNKEKLNFAEWILREVIDGRPPKKTEGMPEIEGTRDPNAPPPTPSEKKGCFIATAACRQNSIEVLYLSKFRDEVLNKYNFGTKFISMYYIVSPSLAKIISNCKIFRITIRVIFLRPFISVLRSFKILD